jgi:hypothetical protein
MSITIKFKRGTASEWMGSASPSGLVLSLGEPGFEKDTGKIKIGDGNTPWALLPYVNKNDEDLQDLIDYYLTSLSGISNVCDTEYVIVQDSNNDTKLINISELSSAMSIIDGGGVLDSTCT